MKKVIFGLSLMVFLAVSISLNGANAGIRDKSSEDEGVPVARRAVPDDAAGVEAAVDPMAQETLGAQESIKSTEGQLDESVEKPVSKTPKRKVERAEAFVADPGWEFDGFVSGGQDQVVRSMFYLHDLIYLNVGASLGVVPGEKIGIYRRGDKVRDPQNGKMLGYEVRRVAIAKVSDKVSDAACSARITNTFEAVEIGDLIRREE